MLSSDATSRRRIQNRIAQQNYRKRIKQQRGEDNGEASNASSSSSIASAPAMKPSSQSKGTGQSKTEKTKLRGGPSTTSKKRQPTRTASPTHIVSPPYVEGDPVCTHHHYLREPTILQSNAAWAQSYPTPEQKPGPLSVNGIGHPQQQQLASPIPFNRSHFPLEGHTFGDDSFANLPQTFFAETGGLLTPTLDYTALMGEDMQMAEIRQDARLPSSVAAEMPKSAITSSSSNERPEDGRTALHKAAFYGHKLVVNVLLEKGADIDARSSDELTALHLAARKGNESVVRLLVEKGADLDARDITGRSSLHLAADQGHYAIVQYLLDKGVDIDLADVFGNTMLHLASEQGNAAVAQMLLEEGADVHAKDNSGRTALHRAAERGHEGIVRLLLERGADINADTGDER
ncbi:MAG: hypothetical protein M1819_007264 [Sarea resinae]|nr:MAG: hypothetical protein M1819_007264 [Sarea resinae]